MARDAKKRQKKLERVRRKRNEQRKARVRRENTGLSTVFLLAARGPIVRSCINPEIFEEGIGRALLARRLPSGDVAVAVFLIDAYCLGVKDVILKVMSQSYLEWSFAEKAAGADAESVEPAMVRKLVEGAAEYAQGLGLSPHPDYRIARRLFGDIDASECQTEFKFGCEGKPLYIPGPYDSPSRIRQIQNALTASCGPDGFDFIIPLEDVA